MKLKHYFFSIVALLLFSLSLNAQTNNISSNAPVTVQSLKDTATTVVKTNLNQVMIEILSGTKEAAGEIYGASKVALKSSVDFVLEQSPLVAKEFLTWKFFEATTYICIWSFVSLVLFLVSFKFHFYMKNKCKSREADPNGSKTTSEGEDFGCACKWISRALSVIIIVAALFDFGLTMVKIRTAPKVYILEYVVDLARGQNTQGR